MLIIIKTKDQCNLDAIKEDIVNQIKQISDIEQLEIFDERDIVIKRKVPVYTPEQLVEKIKQEEKNNGKDN